MRCPDNLFKKCTFQKLLKHKARISNIVTTIRGFSETTQIFTLKYNAGTENEIVPQLELTES